MKDGAKKQTEQNSVALQVAANVMGRAPGALVRRRGCDKSGPVFGTSAHS